MILQQYCEIYTLGYEFQRVILCELQIRENIYYFSLNLYGCVLHCVLMPGAI